MQVYKLVLDGSEAADVRRRTRAGSQPSASSPRRLQLALGVVALLVVGLLLFLKYGARPKPEGSATNPPPAASGAPSATDQKSIAVLAFANLSEDKGNETFSEGISEELLNVLAKVPGLKVTARTSAFHFKGKDTPIPEIARQLGVAYLVEGSVRKADNRVRITAQLIKAADGWDRIWTDHTMSSYDLLDAVNIIIADKQRKRQSSHWRTPDSTILVVELLDHKFDSLAWTEERSFSSDYTDAGFLEIWLADYSTLEAYGEVRLIGLYPPEFWGVHYQPALEGKPYG